MRDLARQLEGVRRRARWLLVGQRLLQAVAVAGPTLVTLGLIDYLLRLPGWLRGAVSLGLAGWLAWWLVHRLTGAWRFGPTVSALALRLENQYDALRGTLASALEFALHPEHYAQPAATAAMAAASVARAERSLAGVRVDRLIDLRPTRRFVGWGAAAAAAVGLLVVAMPTYSGIAASRWLLPWGDAAWPKRVAVAVHALPAVHPVDAPLVLRLDVNRGYRPGMRVWATARPADDPDTPPQRFLMTEQPAPGSAPGSDQAKAGSSYAVSWRPPAEAVRRIGSGRGAPRRWLFTFAAGDADADAAAVTLVARPAVAALSIDVEPPAYAAGLVPPRTLNPPAASPRPAAVPALSGSSVEVTLRLNKPLSAAALRPERLVPGLADLTSLSVDAGDRDAVRFSFVIDEPRQVELVLEDEHGLRPAEATSLRFDPREDRPPTVALLDPRADASVLATAVVPVAGRAADDVGVRRLVLDAAHPTRLDSAAEATQTVLTLADRAARQAELTAEATLDLAPLGLEPGDVVVVAAHAEDVYELNGRSHDTVDATPRRLRVIDAATLIDQVRGELAGVRQQAERLERQQTQLLRRAGDRPAVLRAEQARVSRGVAAQRQQLDAMTRRLAMNRLDEPSLDELIERADDLAAAAEAASDAAGAAFDEADEPSAESPHDAVARAEAQQAEAREQLEALADLLDQGRDALGLRLELSRLRTEQEALAQDTRELLPRAVGRSAEELPDDVREALEELAERQRALAEASEDAVRRLQDTAESLAQSAAETGQENGEQSEQDRAAAEALAEAAAVAQRQGLTPQMEQAERAMEENQLASAGGSQMQALDTLEAMMQQLDEGDSRRQERLRRRLAELAEQLQRLVNEQTAANEARQAEPDAARLTAQAEGQNRLWVRTIAAQTGAEADAATAEVAPLIGQAVAAQARAVAALRGAEREPAAAGQAVALERLEEALRRVREQAAEAERDQTAQQRAELRQKYTELAKRQRTLRGEVQEAVGDGPLTRRARAALRGLGGRQGEIGSEAEALGQEVAETVVFRRTHERIDATSAAAADKLSRAAPDAGTAADDQQRVAVLLESMAAALDDRAAQREFDSGAGAAAGAGGGGGEPQLIPPAAELRLLRGVQQAVYDQTRRLAEAGGAGEIDTARLDALGAEQRELSELGTQLIEQMNQPAAPGVVPEGLPESGPEDGR
ncbi:MAG: hypothetical protein AAF710_06280 [Planctomycetota bacterium]